MADGTVIIDTLLDSTGAEKGLKTLGSIAGKGAKTAVAAIGGVATAIGGIAVAAGNVGMNFEAQMSRVQAISGATAEELERLKDQAVELGAETAFSATETAEGMENLASAGFDVQEIMDAMPGMLDLAASSGEDLAASADIAASTLRGFGLEASDAGHVADVLAKNAADTNAAVADTGEAMKYIAPLAHAAGISLEETAAAIGIMADNGIKGSQAGTTLRGALSRLTKPTDDMKEAMDELGISFYDSEGRMKSLSEQIDMVKSATEGMTDEQRNNYLVTLYGQEALSGMLALMNTQDGKLDEMTESYRNCDGAAEEMATTMQDNLKSAIEQVGGAAESFGITVYESIQDPLKNAAFAAADAIDQITDAFKEEGATGAAEAAGKVMANLLTGIADAIPNVIDTAVAVIDAFIDGIVENKDQLLKAAGEIVTALVEGLVKLLPDEIGEPIQEVFEGIGKSLQRGGLKKGIETVTSLFKTLIKTAGQIIDTVGPALVKILDLIGENLDRIIPLAAGVVTAFMTFKTITGIIETTTGVVQKLFAVLNAHPLVAIISALTGAAAAIGLYQNACSPAAQAAQALEDANDRLGEACSEAGQQIADTIVGIQNAESEYGNYSDSLFATQEELNQLSIGIQETQEGITEILRTESGERKTLTEEEIESLENYYTRQNELYEQQLEIERAKQSAIQERVTQEIASYDESIAEFEQYQEKWLKTAEDAKDAEIELLDQQETYRIAQLQQQYENTDTLTKEQYEQQLEDIRTHYEEERQEAEQHYTELSGIISDKYVQLGGDYQSYLQSYTEYTTALEEENKRFNDAKKALNDKDSAEYEAYKAKMVAEMQEHGEDTAYIDAKMNKAWEDEKVRHNQAMADLNNQLASLLDDSGNQYIQTIIGNAAKIATSGGQMNEAQSQIIDTLIQGWERLPEESDARQKILDMLTPAMEALEESYPAFRNAADKSPEEIIKAWEQLLEDSGVAYNAAKSVQDQAVKGTQDGGANVATSATQVTSNAVNAATSTFNAAGTQMYSAAAGYMAQGSAGISSSDLAMNAISVAAQAVGMSQAEFTNRSGEIFLAAQAFAQSGANGFTAADLQGIFGSNTDAAVTAANNYLAQGAVSAGENAAAYGGSVNTAIINADMPGTMQGQIQQVNQAVNASGMPKAFQTEADKAGNALDLSLQQGGEKAKGTTTRLTTDIKQSLTSAHMDTVGRKAGSDTSGELASGIRSGETETRGAVQSLTQTAIRALQSAGMYDAAYGVGQNFGDGLAAGIASKTQQIASEAAATVRNAINAANAEQDANSPAKEVIPVGENWGGGVVVGIEKMQPEVDAAAAHTMVGAIDAATRKAALAQMRAAIGGTLQRAVMDLSLMRQQPTGNVPVPAEPGEVNQTVNIYQPVKSPVEMSREMKKTAKEMTWH